MVRAFELKMLAAFIVALLAGLFFLLDAPSAKAHGGGLNASGCHNDRKRGGYHCHRSPRASEPVRAVSPRTSNSYYANCSAAYAAGVAPLRRGDAGYSGHLDRDGDGIACENPPSGGSTYVTATPVRPPAVIALPSPGAPVPTANLVRPIEGIAQVLDGDTIQIGTLRVRLFGLDAFEAEQMCTTLSGESYGCGGRATRALIERIDGKAVSCMPKGNDAYDRQLAICRAGTTDLSAWMIREGHGLAYTKYALDYLSDEKAAKQAMAGAWNGGFELPWEYRLTRPSGAAEAQRTALAPSAQCRIKGNVNKRGERVYHLPVDPTYARTKAENWFCSAAEAEKAGFARVN
jgi:endonuclease YncB( thermonuclease family)